MTHTTIRPGTEPVTLINVFTVEPAQQQRLIDLLDEATEQVMRHLPGFVSANIHASLDGTRVTNYAQWRRKDDFEAMLRRLLADRDGGLIAVTLMSSDMGKLYAALSDALDRRR